MSAAECTACVAPICTWPGAFAGAVVLVACVAAVVVILREASR